MIYLISLHIITHHFTIDNAPPHMVTPLYLVLSLPLYLYKFFDQQLLYNVTTIPYSNYVLDITRYDILLYTLSPKAILGIYPSGLIYFS